MVTALCMDSDLSLQVQHSLTQWHTYYTTCSATVHQSSCTQHPGPKLAWTK